MAKPEYITVLIDDNLNQGWLDLCRTAPDALILGVHGQDPTLRTIQYLKEWRYLILDSLHDINATYWKGIVLNSRPLTSGTCGDLIVQRHTVSGQVISVQFREEYKYPNSHSTRLRGRRQSQNQILARRGHGQLVKRKTRVDLVKLVSGKLIPGHTMDIVLNIPSTKNGPIKLISK